MPLKAGGLPFRLLIKERLKKRLGQLWITFFANVFMHLTALSTGATLPAMPVVGYPLCL
jgi:hypothetical protein